MTEEYELGDTVEVRTPPEGVRVSYVTKFDDAETRLLAKVASFHGVSVRDYIHSAVMEKASLPQWKITNGVGV